ncbi:MAG: glycosyltransferase family 9 protein [Muribaculaceae bacterium]
MARKTEPKNVLITRFSALGDVAMTIPVVYGACAENPAVRFVMLTRKLPASLFLDPPPNLEVVAVDFAGYPGALGMRKLLDEMIDGYGIDTVVDLHDVLRTKLIRFWAALRGLNTSHVRKGRKERKALTRRKEKSMIPLRPMPEKYREAFDRLHIDVSDSFRHLFPSGKGNPSLFSKASAPKNPGERWLAIAPFAAHAGKIYPLSLMKEVVDHYASLPDTKIFIFGAGEKEKAEISRLAEGRSNVVSMAEKAIGMAGELSLMSHCDTMLAMDSANMHLASLVGLRTVSIWGATHPYTGFYGFRQRPEDAVQLDMVCRPCSIYGNRPCHRGDYHCLNGISPQLVIAKIDSKTTK